MEKKKKRKRDAADETKVQHNWTDPAIERHLTAIILSDKLKRSRTTLCPKQSRCEHRVVTSPARAVNTSIVSIK
jgi:hypothetical protein